MTDFIERMVQRITETAPIENAVSSIVAGVLQSTALKMTRGEPGKLAEAHTEDAAA
jgi:hypothetical protein